MAGEGLARSELVVLLRRVHEALAAHQQELDDLNVFPVPDGDTGSNMTLTLAAALADPAADADAIAQAALRGARGNSGVILSQIVRALIEVAATEEPLDCDRYRWWLRRARDLSYEAVARPVEGTILTALTAAVAAAEAVRDTDLVTLSAAVCAAVRDAVQTTMEQLDVLRRAGVVDAGARGFEVVLGAVHEHIGGEPIAATVGPVRVRSAVPIGEGCEHGGDSSEPFEVQYLLEADDAVAAPLRSRLGGLGDSVVVVAAGGLLKVHVHTAQVGAAIEAGMLHGRVSGIEVTHFAEQIARRHAAATEADARATVGTVCVLPGPGLRDIAEEHRAAVVDGTAGSLPSVADLLNAVGTVDAERVVLLPGHPNVVATAHQASAVSQAEGGRELVVVEEADNPLAVLAALAVVAPTDELGLNITAMSAAAGSVVAAEVTAAVRDADTDVGPIRSGQHLAIVEGSLVAADDDPVDALRQAVRRLVATQPPELVTLVVGAAVSADEATRAEAVVADEVPAAEQVVILGGQRPARYLVGSE